MKLKYKKCMTLTMACLLGSMSACDDDWPLPFDMTGIVFDATTGKPLEGAYVLATYSKASGTFGGHSSSFCYTTRGMYTGKDGSYRLPVLGKNYGSPGSPAVIKAGYTDSAYNTDKNNDVYREKNKLRDKPKLYYSDWHVYLAQQDPLQPNLRFPSAHCERAETAKDGAASAEFLKLELEEKRKYGGHKGSIEATESQMNRMQSLPQIAKPRNERDEPNEK